MQSVQLAQRTLHHGLLASLKAASNAESFGLKCRHQSSSGSMTMT
jgi:hypothetical protein